MENLDAKMIEEEGLIRYDKDGKEKFRSWSTTSLIAGILIPIFSLTYLFIGITQIAPLFAFLSLLSIVISISFGASDLVRINNGVFSRKGRGMDLTGIIIGSIWGVILLWTLANG